MADLKISQLTGATTPLTGTEEVPLVQSGTTKKVTVDSILSPAAGKGVNFAANAGASGMTSELFNWYEEGTWTPVNSGMIVVSGAWAATGRYTRIGDIVYWTVNQTSGTVNANATVGLVSGLPYTPAAQTPGTITNGAGNMGGAVLVETNKIVYSALTFINQTALRISGFYRV